MASFSGLHAAATSSSAAVAAQGGLDMETDDAADVGDRLGSAPTTAGARAPRMNGGASTGQADAGDGMVEAEGIDVLQVCCFELRASSFELRASSLSSIAIFFRLQSSICHLG